MSYATPSELPTFNQLLKCRNARVSGFRSVWYQNEKMTLTEPVKSRIRGPSPVFECSGIGLKCLNCHNLYRRSCLTNISNKNNTTQTDNNLRNIPQKTLQSKFAKTLLEILSTSNSVKDKFVLTIDSNVNKVWPNNNI